MTHSLGLEETEAGGLESQERWGQGWSQCLLSQWQDLRMAGSINSVDS